MLRRKHVYNFYFCLKTGDIYFQTFPYILRLILIFCRSWHGLTTDTYMENMKFSHKDVANMIFGLFPFQKRIRLTLNYLVFFVFSRKTPSCNVLRDNFFWENDFSFFYLPYFQYELYWSCLVDIRILGSILTVCYSRSNDFSLCSYALACILNACTCQLIHIYL